MISLNEAMKKFEDLRNREFEIAIEVTVPVTISFHKSVESSEKDDTYPSCGMQFDNDDVHCTLIDLPFDQDELVKILKIDPDQPIWDVILDDEYE
jgi:hypothetical protein